MNPPAPSTVTLPAHRPPARTPPPAPRCVPVSRRAMSRIPTRSMRYASCPKSQARCASGCEPRSSFACPRLSTSPIQPCPPPRAMWLRAAVGVRRSAPFASLQARASATASPRAGRAQAAHRCWAAPPRAERVAALRASVGVRTAIPPRARSTSGSVFARARLRAWRSARSHRGPASLRSHPAASGFG